MLKYLTNIKKIFSVSYEYKDRKISFQPSREILYSIRDYFKYLLRKDFTTYTETAYIKIKICYFTIPHHPKINKIIEIYKNNFYRLDSNTLLS